MGSAVLGACKGLLAVPALLAISQIFPPAVRVTAGDRFTPAREGAATRS